MIQRVSRGALHGGSRILVARHVDLQIEGARHLPRCGPVLLAARHYHHFWDGCILLAAAPWPLHLLVGLDWVRSRAARWGMEAACAAACWPVVLRDAGLTLDGLTSAYRRVEAGRYLRRAVRQSVTLLQEGHGLVVFPEGYPTIDPGWTPKTADTVFLPFQDGFVRIVELAQKAGSRPVPIVPTGFVYEHGRRPRVRLRFGRPVYVTRRAARRDLVRSVEATVIALSRPALLPGRDDHTGGTSISTM